MKLLMYEIRKNFFKRYLLIILLALTLANILSIYGVYQNKHVFSTDKDHQWSRAFWELYEGKFKGELTHAKINELMEIYNPVYERAMDQTFSTEYDPNTYTGYMFGDYRMLDLGFMRPIEYAYMYRSNAREIADRAIENSKFFYSIGNTYQYKSNIKIASLFTNREISHFYHIEMYENLFRYDFSSFLILLLCILGLVPVFVMERETDMDVILWTSKYGRGKTANVKILASFLYVIVISAWFYTIDFISFSYFYRLTGLTQVLYALQDFFVTPLNVEMWEFILISSTVKILGLLVIASVILFVSSFFNRTLLPYVTSLSIVFLFMLLHNESFAGNTYGWIQLINPVGLIANRQLFHDTEFINILGFPAHVYSVAILMALVLTSFFVLGTKATLTKNVSVLILKERKKWHIPFLR